MTECLLCKGQIEEKGSFLQLFLLKGEGPSCCSTCYQNFERIVKREPRTPFPVDLKMSKHLQASGAALKHSAI